MDTVSGRSLVEELCTHLRENTVESFDRLVLIWKDLWSPEEIEKRTHILTKKFVQSVCDTLTQEIDQETETRSDFSSRLVELLDEISKLSTELSVQIPYRDVERLPFHSMAVILNKRATEHRKIRDDRVQQLQELLAREHALAASLGKDVNSSTKLPAVPSEKELIKLSEHVQMLAEEKSQKMASFLKKRESVVSLFDKLGAQPVLNFEKEVLSSESISDFTVTDQNLAKVDDLVAQLKERVARAEENRNFVVSKLKRLWELLDKPTEEKSAFVNKYCGITCSDIAALNEELELMEQERSASISKLVHVLRKELVEQWDKCLVAQETRDKFQYFKVVTFNDDIYHLHELEVERWKSFYTDNSHIFDLIGRHEKLFSKLVHLSGNTRDNNRFQNRGGQLLKEERERKAVAKDLPRVEEQLRAALVKYEQTHGTPFTDFGIPLVEKLDKQWRAKFDQKTIDKFHSVNSSNMRTPLATKRPANTPSTTGGKIQRMAYPGSTPRAGPSRRLNVDDTTYDEFEKPLVRKDDLTATRMMSFSTENLTTVGKSATKGLKSIKSTPNIASPRWTKHPKTPKTVPRARKQCNTTTLKTKLKPIF